MIPKCQAKHSKKPFIVFFISLLLFIFITNFALAQNTTLNPYDNDPIGGKTPLILIHGLKSDPSVWNNFIDYFNSDLTLTRNYKIYTFGYDSGLFDNSDEWAISNMGGVLRDKIETYNNSGEWANRPVVVLAHSMGGLIARSFMQRHWFTNGPQGGERVLGLITLGTPHHGSPAANYCLLGFCVAGLRWDDYDNTYLPPFPLTVNNSGLRCINNYNNINIFNTESCPNTDEFTRNGFYNKIIAYGGSASASYLLSESLMYAYGELLVANRFLSALYDTNNNHSYQNNDGIVPIQSALFDDWSIRDRRRSDDYNCSHYDLTKGFCKFDGNTEFDKIKQDILRFSPIITNSQSFSSNYFVGQTINQQYEITNKGPEPVTVANLTIGGRDPYGQVADFPSKTCVTLQPNVPYTYTGSLTVTKTGTYSFSPAYDTLAIGTTCPDSKALWNMNISDEAGNIQPKYIVVNEVPTVSPITYNNDQFVSDITIPDGTLIIPGQGFLKTWRMKNTGTNTWNNNYKWAFVSQSGSYQMGGPAFIAVPKTVAPGETVDLSVNLTAPASNGTYYGYWMMQDPNGKWFGQKIWVKIEVNNGTTTFQVGDWVKVAGTGGIGLQIRNCAGLSCQETCLSKDGNFGKITDGPQSANGYTWWKISWDGSNNDCSSSAPGWSAQNWFVKIPYPLEGNIIKASGINITNLYKNGKKWVIANDDIFNKMGFSVSNMKDLPWDMFYSIPTGGTIVDNGTLIRLQGNSNNPVYLIQNNQKQLITSTDAFNANGYRQENVIDVTSAVMDSYPQGADISSTPKILLVTPSGGESYLTGNQVSIIWAANTDAKYINLLYSTDGRTDGSANWNIIATGLSNTGNYTWTPNFTAANVNVKAVAFNSSGLSSQDISKSTFAIQDVYKYADFVISSFNPSSNSVTAGQQITMSTVVTNQGNGASTPTNVKYYYSATSTGKDYFLGESSVPALIAGGSASLSATVTIPTSNILQGYLVAVVNPDYYAAESTTANNTASAPVSIIDNVPPTINSLTFGWGTYKTGLALPFVFNVTDNIGVKSLGFYYSTDNGTTWNTITDYFVPGSNGYGNSYYWTIPTTITAPASLLVKMIAKDASGNVSQPMTTGPFTVMDGSKPSVTIISPNGGEIFDLGSTHTITWSVNAPNGINKMSLELHWADQAIYLADITNNTTGTYTWTVSTSSSYLTNNAKIRISVEDKNFNTNEDYSDNYFTIRDPSTPPPAPWTMPTVVTAVPSGTLSYTSKNDAGAAIATDSSGNLHMVYLYTQDDLSGTVNYPPGPSVIRQDVMYKKLTGTIWSNPVVVYSITQNSDASGNGFHSITDMQIAADSNNLPHIVWTDSVGGSITSQNQNDIFYTYLNGTSWSTPQNLSNSMSGTVSANPRIAADSSGNVHVVWVDGYSWNADYTTTGKPNIYYLKKDASGNWSTPSQLTTDYATLPYISIGKNGNIHIAYLNASPGISYMTFNGSSWTAPADLGLTSGGVINYIKVVPDSGNNLHLVWHFYETSTSQDQVLYSHYDGAAWSAPEKVSDLPPDIYTAYQPSIVVDSQNRPHVVFEEIYYMLGKLIYRYRDANGWSAPEQVNLNSQAVGSGSSRVAISNDDHLHVVWGSGYNGSNEVFYNHAPLQGGINDITPPSTALIAPVGGETLSISSSYTITWSATDNVGVTSVALDFTTDDGVSFTPIASNLSNGGTYQWTVPNLASTNVHVRITAQDAAGNKGYALSGKFSVSDVTPPSVMLVSPKGGEVWQAGSTQTIQWTATDNIGVTGVDLSYSTDGMISWSPIASSITGTSYQWTVPPTLSSNCVVKVVAKDASGNAGQNTSDWSFAIVSTNRPPYQPNTSDPANSAAGVVATKILSWSGGDPDSGDTVTYDVYVGSCGSMALVSGGQTGTSYTPQNLGNGQIYCWQVVAKDNHGNTNVAPVWMFTTERPASPILSVSAGNVVYQSIVGKSANSQTITIDNAGGGTLNWNMTSNVPWLGITGGSGTNSGAAAISVDTTGLAAGSYPAVVTIASNEATNSPVTIPVTLLINPLTYSVTLIFSGTGSGTVTSTPPVIACNTDCMTPFDPSTNVSLNAAPDQFSLFSGWSGVCTNATGNCAFTMNSDTSVTATFNKDTAHSVRIDGTTPSYYSSILGAYTSSVAGDIIKAWGTDFTENLNFNLGSTVSIKGGYDSAYTTNAGFTILHGVLTIGTGSVVMDKLIIQ